MSFSLSVTIRQNTFSFAPKFNYAAVRSEDTKINLVDLTRTYHDIGQGFITLCQLTDQRHLFETSIIECHALTQSIASHIIDQAMLSFKANFAGHG